MNRRNKFLTLVFSLFPGAGHMYMGYLTQGTQLMLLFLLVCFVVVDFRFMLLGFLIPVIWFYSLFDAYNRYEGTEIEEITTFNIFEWLQLRPKWIGWALIITGSFMVLDRVLFPLLPYQWRDFIQTGIVAVILIWGGITLLMGTKPEITYHPELQIPDQSTFCQGEVIDTDNNEEV